MRMGLDPLEEELRDSPAVTSMGRIGAVPRQTSLVYKFGPYDPSGSEVGVITPMTGLKKCQKFNETLKFLSFLDPIQTLTIS